MDIKEVRIERIKAKMNEHGLSSRELAKRSNISESGISRILSGEIDPRVKTFTKIAEALHVDPVWLMGVDDESSHDFSVETKEMAMTIERMTPKERYEVDNFIKYIISKRNVEERSDT